MALSFWPAVGVFVVFLIVYRQANGYVQRRKWRKLLQVTNGSSPANATQGTILPLNLGQLTNLLWMLWKGTDLIEADPFRFNKFGNKTYAVWSMGSPSMVLTCDPENIKSVLATDFGSYGIGNLRKVLFEPLLGKGIFTTEGHEWEHYRALFRPQFNRELINDLEGTDHACQVMLKAIGDVAPGQWTAPVDLMPIFYRLSLDTVTKFLFGESTNSQAAALGDNSKSVAGTQLAASQEFADAFTNAQQWTIYRAQSGPFLAKYIGSPKYYRSIAILHEFSGNYVRKAMGLPEKEKTSEKKKFSLMESLVDACKDEVELRNQLLALMAAGRDTTSTLLCWALLLLAAHPQEYQRLRNAVIEDVGTEGDSAQLDFAKLKGCRYVQYVLNETLRLFPPVAFNQRTCEKDTVLPTGGGPNGDQPVPVLKGTTVGLIIHHMHRHKDLWGEDPESFKPSRWMSRKQSWSYLPFNGGPRICLGQQYALTEAAFVLVRLVQRFEALELAFDAAGKTSPYYDDNKGRWVFQRFLAVVQAPKHGVWLRMKRAGPAAAT